MIPRPVAKLYSWIVILALGVGSVWVASILGAELDALSAEIREASP